MVNGVHKKYARNYERRSERVTEEDILSKITDEMETDDKEDDDDDTDPSQSSLTSQEHHQSVQSLRTFF
ncbi:hypothetical protein AVEN_14857-1 [Araneus ventricosus]|uniref:Uncharacterized protein n=1 Tax=Araneus ventricosus TaxID=182803 RepID=A0A4Y2R4S4_ARAVE|nr:hypothetical protein AVEN_14857-1 [Araneus ventricosus]